MKMNNAIDLIKKDMQRHKVIVKLPNEKKEEELYLILITAKTSKLMDFKKTYRGKAIVTLTHLKIAQKIFDNTETENVYGIFLNKNLQMVFAFNRDFADYDSEKKLIVYKDIDDVLTDEIETKDDVEDNVIKIPKRRDMFPGGGGSMLIKYSLAEKKV